MITKGGRVGRFNSISLFYTKSRCTFRQIYSACFAGYEYTVEATFGGYGPVEKTYHLCRRRRWVRNRVVVRDSKVEEEEVKQDTWALMYIYIFFTFSSIEDGFYKITAVQ